jgi:hypothetical protein
MPMHESTNPWIELPTVHPYVLSIDEPAIVQYNCNTSEQHRLRLDVLPEPFIGSLTAPVVILGLNPGFDDRDPAIHASPQFQELLRANYHHSLSDFPFFFLDPRFKSPGREWWEQKLKPLLDMFTPEETAHSLFCVEYFPYHSQRFRHMPKQLPSQWYGFHLVSKAINRNAVIVIMRARELWLAAVPALKTYSSVYTLNSPQNVVISPRNCPGFEVIVSAIRNGYGRAFVPHA